eukprot:g26893.t1
MLSWLTAQQHEMVLDYLLAAHLTFKMPEKCGNTFTDPCWQVAKFCTPEPGVPDGWDCPDYDQDDMGKVKACCTLACCLTFRLVPGFQALHLQTIRGEWRGVLLSHTTRDEVSISTKELIQYSNTPFQHAY